VETKEKTAFLSGPFNPVGQVTQRDNNLRGETGKKVMGRRKLLFGKVLIRMSLEKELK